MVEPLDIVEDVRPGNIQGPIDRTVYPLSLEHPAPLAGGVIAASGSSPEGPLPESPPPVLAIASWPTVNPIGRHPPGKPYQNPYIESFNGHLREGGQNEHWFISLPHVKVMIEAWPREYNEEQPKTSLGGLTPSAYARQLAGKSATLPLGL